ncbi:MAG: cation-translocating P-type ATPase [Acidobacteriia bacterium]|nr:cation-translocating P-type ATPase [Terriglobia bacterium]
MDSPEQTPPVTGLSEQEAVSRLQAEGPNELPSSRARSIAAITWGILTEPMILLLAGAAIVYLLLGELRDSLILLASVLVVVGISLYQERKTERALEALRDLSSPRALVIRGGQERRIAGREVVRGDLIVLSEGDRVPADAIVLSATNLSVDESLLTGESVPVSKSAGSRDADMGLPGGDDLPFVFSGTLVVRGSGNAEVKAIGLNTQLGRIGKSLQSLVPEKTHLEKETSRLVGILATLGLGVCVLIALIYGFTRHDWLNGTLAGITAAISLLPEEFPVVLTVFLALGAWRIAKHNVLTRQPSAIEALGAATVLCVDKTGTLTENKMSVQKLWAHGGFCDLTSEKQQLPEDFHALVEFAILASERKPFDPMDLAFQDLGERFLLDTEHLHPDWGLVHEYPLVRERLALARVWRNSGTQGYIVAAKGAPEAIAELCHLGDGVLKDANRVAAEMASEGLRLLGVARAHLSGDPLPQDPKDFVFEFLGLVGLADPIRADVPAAVQECSRAGVRVVMITGDYPETARYIARQIGLLTHSQVLTGKELDTMNDVELRARIEEISVFARAVPEHKLRLVEALKARGEVVAMTGDGVNDAPALKAAHIGIAMGKRGTDVARESADLVLLDDAFPSIVQAIRLGRRIFDNLRRAMAYVVSVHIPVAGLALLPVIFRYPIVLLPLHVVFLELIVDPACSIAFEAEREAPGIMTRPPRSPSEPLFSRPSLFMSILGGSTVLLISLGAMWLGLHRGEGEGNVRILAFGALLLGNLALILANRSWTRSVFSLRGSANSALWWIVGGAFGLFLAILAIPGAREAFRFSTVHADDLVICFAAGLLNLLVLEALKWAVQARMKMV